MGTTSTSALPPFLPPGPARDSTAALPQDGQLAAPAGLLPQLLGDCPRFLSCLRPCPLLQGLPVLQNIICILHN